MMQRTLPQSREEFKFYCLRRLGWPTIEINLDEDTIYDRINDAVEYYQLYHYDGQMQIYYKHQLTQEDLDNEYITIPNTITGITKLIDGSVMNSASYLFNVNYQLALNDFFNITANSVVPYYLTIQHINMFEDLFAATPGVIFNQNVDRIYIQTNWNFYNVGQYLVFDGYQYIDPDEYPKVWSDMWLLKYATQLIKRNWGEVMSKFNGVALLGGITMNGYQIYQDANQEIEKLEQQMIEDFSFPPFYGIGAGG